MTHCDKCHKWVGGGPSVHQEDYCHCHLQVTRFVPIVRNLSDFFNEDHEQANTRLLSYSPTPSGTLLVRHMDRHFLECGIKERLENLGFRIKVVTEEEYGHSGVAGHRYLVVRIKVTYQAPIQHPVAPGELSSDGVPLLERWTFPAPTYEVGGTAAAVYSETPLPGAYSVKELEGL